MRPALCWRDGTDGGPVLAGLEPVETLVRAGVLTS